MAIKVLSIEIGQGLTRVAEMDYKTKNPKIYNCFTFETPQNVVQDGIVSRNEVFASLLKSECKKRKIKTNRVVFSVTSGRITNRDVKIPNVKKSQIQDVITANAADFFPVDMTQYHLVYNPASAVLTEDKKQLSLNLLAVPNEITNSYYDFALSCGLVLQALDYVGNSVCQVVREALSAGTSVVVKIDEKNTLITILQDGKTALQRTIGYGIDDAIETVRKNPAFGTGLSYADAIEVLCGKTCIRRYLNTASDYREAEDTDRTITEARIQVTESLRYLMGNISRVLEYYVSRNSGVVIETVALVGLGADFSGLSKLMSNELNMKVRVFQNIKNAGYTLVNAEYSLNINRYAACIGAGKAPLNLIPEPSKSGVAKREGTNKKSGKSGGSLLGGAAVLAVGAAAAVFLAAYAIAGYTNVNLQKAEIEENIAKMEANGTESVYREYKTVKELTASFHNVYETTRSRNEDLVAFIEELEEKMPSSLLVINFTATSRGVTMSVETESKEAAAKTLMQLRNFESIEVVSSTGLTDNLDEVSERIVAFTVDCVYKPVADEAAEMEGN